MRTTNSKAARAGAKGKTPKPLTKKDQLIRLLRTKAGAGVGTISSKLGWQVHTTRAALSGLRKAGFELVAERPGDGKPMRYRIASGSAVGPSTAVKPAGGNDAG